MLGPLSACLAVFASELSDTLLQEVAKHQTSDKMSLKESLLAVRKDPNFWFLNLYSPMEKPADQMPADQVCGPRQAPWYAPPGPSHSHAPKGAKGDSRGSRRDSPYNGSKGGESAGGKGGGKGGGNSQQTTRTGMPVPTWQQKPDDWHDDATKSPPKPPNYLSGQAICFDYHSSAGCRAGCHRDHAHCPRLLASGS